MIGPVLPSEGDEPKFAQVFVVFNKNNQGAEVRNSNVHHLAEKNILLRWQKFLTKWNPYAKIYRSTKEILYFNSSKTLRLTTVEGRNVNKNTYNAPTVDEVAVVVQNGEERSCLRDIQLQQIGGES
ncbi:hypothetical protein O181_061905 [Austropuccinia psidii MF-1]|uniref:Uncharacterized protein n=1 Tax=Austropuccinia psidii MF-1 TaxID=1389203 RepID=A0A9Q3I0W9_9BASI|nr:hypothetical protein [Austropuccinia psidii MF-1]